MDTWAKATPEDREAIFNQTAVTKGVTPEIGEKDFWVCWTLQQIAPCGVEFSSVLVRRFQLRLMILFPFGEPRGL